MNVSTKGNITKIPQAKALSVDMLAVDEVAELCGMTVGRVYQLLRSGEMKGTKYRNVYWQITKKQAAKFRHHPDGGGRPRNG